MSRGDRREEVGVGVAGRLRQRHAEIEQTIFDYVRQTAADHIGDSDVEYVTGLREAVAAAVEYALTGIEHGEDWPVPIPPAAIVQAARAARGGVRLDIVLLRYVTGHTLLEDFIIDEAVRVFSADATTLRYLRRIQVALLGRLTATIAEEYREECERARPSSAQRLGERVQRLLLGEPVDTSELGYELDAWHLGVIATRPKAEQTVRSLAGGVGLELLLVPRGEQTVWAWFGDTRQPAIANLGGLLPANERVGVSLAIGEPGHGLSGLRLTHRQAQAALLVAMRRPQWLTRYADVALLAFALRDEALARSLIDVYLSPLDHPSRGSEVLRPTLRAYLATERNASSTAAVLGVARHTVEQRIGRVEQRLGRLLPTCMTELDVALRLEELGDVAVIDRPPPVQAPRHTRKSG